MCYTSVCLFFPFPFMALMSKKTNKCSVGCMITKWVVAILLLLLAVAALIGVFKTHVMTGATGEMYLQFGTTGGSFAILAFTVAVTSGMKQLVGCMSKCEVCA